MAQIAEMFVRIGADVRDFERKMQQVTQRMDTMSKQLGAIGRTLTTRVTLPLVAAAGGILMAAGKFEQAMNRVQALTGATADQFGSLSDTARELGRTTQYSASQAADAMGYLAMAGFDAERIIGAMPSTLQLAAAAQLDLASAADITSNILTGYRLNIEDLSSVNDVLVKAFTSSNTNLQQLGEAMKYAGPLASGMGVAFEETAAAIGLMGNAGIQASMAGTSLRGALSKLANPTEEGATLMRQFGINAFDTEGNLRSLVDIIGQLEQSGITAAQMIEVFGLRAGPAMQALVAQGADALSIFTEKLRDSGGIAQSVAETQMRGLMGALIRLKSVIEGVAISFGEAGLRGAAMHVIGVVTTLAQKLGEASRGTKQLILVAAGIVAAMGPAALAIAGVTATLGVLAAHPLLVGATLAIAGIAALAAGFVSWRDRIRQTNEALNRTKQSLADLDLAEVARDLRLIGGEIAAKRIAVGASTQYRMLGMAPEAIRAATEQTLQRDPQYERLLERERELTEHYAALRAKAVDVALRQIRAQAQPPPGPPPLPQRGRDRGLMPYHPYPEYDLRSIIGMPGATTGLRAPVEIDATTREFSKAWMKATIPMANVADTTQDVNTKMGLFSSSISQVVYGLNAMLNILPGGAGGKWARVARIGLGAAGLVSGFTGFTAGLSALGGLFHFQHGGIVTRPTLATVGERGPEAVIPLNRLSLPPTHVHLYLDGHELTTVVADRLPRELARRGAA